MFVLNGYVYLFVSITEKTILNPVAESAGKTNPLVYVCACECACVCVFVCIFYRCRFPQSWLVKRFCFQHSHMLSHAPSRHPFLQLPCPPPS